MDRDLDRLSRETFDLVVVGGGILGAFVTLLAARTGLRTALLEKDDFASGTTSGSGKVVHGGIRYLQELRFPMARRAQQEQERLAGMAPGLMRPLPFFVPSRKRHLRESLVLRAGAWAWKAFRAITGGGAALPATRFVPRDESVRVARDLGTSLAGGLLFFDVQLRSPERFTFEIIRAARLQGAVVANYAEVVDFRVIDDRLRGVNVEDHIGGQEFKVHGEQVVNAAGAWTPRLAASLAPQFPDVAFGRGIHVVLDRPEPAAALALPYDGQSSADPTGGSQRRVFVMPWEGKTLVGASYMPHRGEPDESNVSGREALEFVHGLADQWPGLHLADSQMLYAYSGLYPVFGRRKIPAREYAASPHPLIVDHGARGGPRGLVSVMSVKMTTARHLAAKVLEIILDAQNSRVGLPPDAGEGNLPQVDPQISEMAGTSWEMLGSANELPAIAEHAARHEMARRLSDVLFRRSWIGHLGHPGPEPLEEAALVMGRYLGWTEAERGRQIQLVDALYSQWGESDRADSGAPQSERTIDDATSDTGLTP